MSLDYDRLGTGPPLVLLHGVGSRRQVWSPVLVALSRTHRVIVPDLPGHGTSPLTPGVEHWDVYAYADVIESFCTELGIDRPHVAGNSLGGGVALELARRGSIASATALAPIGFWSPRERSYCVACLRLSRIAAKTLRPHLDQVMSFAPARALMLGQMFARPLRIPADVAAADAASFADSEALPLTLKNAHEYDFADGHELRVPITIGWGDRDYVLLSRQATRARARLPQARHVSLRGCGHVPMSDDPEAVAALIASGA